VNPVSHLKKAFRFGRLFLTLRLSTNYLLFVVDAFALNLSAALIAETIFDASCLAVKRSFCAFLISERAALRAVVLDCINVELPLSGVSDEIPLIAACACVFASETFALKSARAEFDELISAPADCASVILVCNVPERVVIALAMVIIRSAVAAIVPCGRINA